MCQLLVSEEEMSIVKANDFCLPFGAIHGTILTGFICE
jgi:hypothetical protein